MKRTLILQTSLLALTLALPSIVHAEDIIISVTRESLPISKVGQAVDVLTDADIKSYQSLSIASLLAHTTDLSLVSNGGPGASASASIRGAGADHTLYLLDGIALNDPSQVGGGVDLGVLSTGDTSRIEVLRGPLSTLWGSGALGGVVSITSREAKSPLEGDIALEGLDQYGSARVGIGGKSGGLNWRLFAGGLNDRGVSAYDEGTEKDGFTQTELSAKVSYALSESTTIRALALKTHSRSDFDGFAPPTYAFGDDGEFGKADTKLGALGLTNVFSGGTQTLSLSATQTDRDLHDPDGTPNFVSRGRIVAADYHLSYRLTDATRLLVGARTERDDMRSVSTYSPLASKAMTVSGIYGQVTQALGTATVTASARHDDSSSFGGQDLGQLSVSLPAGDHWRLHASAGQGVKIPSLYQLFGDYGTATLKPEKALSVDAGADYTFTGGQVSVTAFTRNVRDLIDFDNSSFTYQNIARSKASGAEVEWTQSLSDRLSLRANYSVLTTRNESHAVAATYGKRLARRPDTMGSVDVNYVATQKLTLGIGLRAAGNSFDNAANTVPLKAYATADLRANYALSDAVNLYGRLENASDQRYETAKGYGQLGRRLWLGIRSTFF